MNWNLFKEQWPHFKANPIRWIIRWWNNKRSFKKYSVYLNTIACEYNISRLPDETDNQFRARILQLMAEPPITGFLHECHHVFETRQIGGDPAEMNSVEWVSYCTVCGKEYDGY